MRNEKYQFESFLKYPQIAHGVSTAAFGSMKGLATLDVDRSVLTKFADTIGITSAVVCMKQIHSGNVSVVADAGELRISDTDGLITNKKNIPLAVLTADCLPILFFDPKNEVIGVAHGGYKGLLNHIIEHMIQRFIKDFNSNPKDILVGIGPSIERDCYEVGVDLIEKFQEEFPSFENIFAEKSFDKLRMVKYFLDLSGIAEQCLVKEGILKEHIAIMDICTKHDPNSYSYRRGDGDKRFASVISLV